MSTRPQRADALSETIAMILAGGEGERLYPLTRDRAKPAVPFGGNYRLIDFTLSSCLNSGVRRIHVLTQYKSDSLNRHLRLAWNIFNPALGEYIEMNPPQQRLASHWYHGTADAIYQNIYTLQRERPRYVLVLSGDHVYKMDYGPMIRQHLDTGAALTIACIARPLEEASRLGVLELDDEMSIQSFHEKPVSPPCMPGSKERALCSMGVYMFTTETLVRRVVEDSKKPSTHDFGRDVVPTMIKGGDKVLGHAFQDTSAGREPYWRDIGTLAAYWEANMDLLPDDPVFDPYDPEWPVRTYVSSGPPAKIVCVPGESEVYRADACEALFCDGAIVRGAEVHHSIIGRNVHIDPGSRIEQSVLLDDVQVGRDVTIQRAIVDKGNRVPDGFSIGVDPEQDRHHFTVSEGGIVVVPKEMPLFAPGRRTDEPL